MRVVYAVVLPLMVAVLIAAGQAFWAVVLLISAVASIMMAPQDRRDQLLGRRA